MVPTPPITSAATADPSLAPTPTDPVAESFDALILRLSEHALGGNFERGVRYRAAIISLRDRWVAGEMPRASKQKDAA